MYDSRLRFVSLVDALWAVHGRKKLPGITNLRPPSNGGKFLRRLRKAESRIAKKAGGVPMPLFAVGGDTKAGGLAGWMNRRFFGGIPNDLVVPLPSSTPVGFRPTAETTCNHFGYFAPEEIKKNHATEAVRFLLTGMGIRQPDAPTADSRPHAGEQPGRTAAAPVGRKNLRNGGDAATRASRSL